MLEGAAGTPLGGIAASVGTAPAGYTQEAHGLSAFALSEGVVYHTYSTYARGPEFLLGFYALLDRAPLGRNGATPQRARGPDAGAIRGCGSAATTSTRTPAEV